MSAPDDDGQSDQQQGAGQDPGDAGSTPAVSSSDGNADPNSMFPDQLSDDVMSGAEQLSGTGRTYRASCPGSKAGTGIVVRATGMSKFAPTNNGSCTAYLGFFDSTGAKKPTLTVRIDPGAQVDLTAELSEYAFCAFKCELDCNGDCVIDFSDG
jgi:hypothetical protein